MNQRDKESLMNAVATGTFRDVQNAFNECNLVFDESYFDYKLLRKASIRNHQGIINFLLNKIGCRAGNPNKVKLEKTPLHLVMRLDSEYIIKKMLSKGALIFDKDENGEIPLLTGFKNENDDAVRALLTHCKPICNRKCKDAILQFHIACITNHKPAVEHYLQCGIDPNIPLRLDSEEYSGLNPVQLAAEKNYYEVFQKLVQHGGDLSIKNSNGLTPLHIIYYTSSTEDRISRIKRTFEIGNDTKFFNAVDNNGVSHFHLCCMLNEPDFIQEFLDNEANVNSSISLNSTINPGFTPLHFAVTNGCEKVVELLLKNGANCNKKNKEGKTPLHLVGKILGYWKAHIIKMLLDYKGNPAIKDNEGYTPLHMEFYCVNSMNQNTLDILLSKISTKINFTNNEGLSHFHIACTTNNINQVKDFLDSGVKIDSRVSLGMYSGYTALHFAALHNQKDVVKLLLKKNAHVNFITREFQVTPLHLACEFNFTKFCEKNPNQSLESFKSFPINLDSTSNGMNQLDIINLLLSHGAMLDAKDCDGNVPLIHACMIEKNYCKLKWYYNSCEYLSRIERGSLIREIKTRLMKIIEIFLHQKAYVYPCTNKQESILHIICKYTSLKIPKNIIKLILIKGTDIDAVDIDGLTALHAALKCGNNRMATMLLRLKANVNIKCKDSKIPLHTVFKKGYSEHDMFCELLENGSDVNILTGNSNETLLQEAIRTQNKFAVKKLLYYGADVNLGGSSNTSCFSSFLEWNNNDNDHWEDYEFAEIFEIVYTHVQKLLALGLYVSKKTKKYCKLFYACHKAMLSNSSGLKNLDNTFHNCTKELERLKLRMIDNYSSLYSILLKDSHELSKHVRNKSLIEIIKPQYSEEFPLYIYLLKLQFRRGLIRSDSLKFAKGSLSNIINTDLPDLCLDLIIKYLTNEDIANLKAALSNRSLKRKLKDSNSSQIEDEEEREDEYPREKRLRLRNKDFKNSKKSLD